MSEVAAAPADPAEAEARVLRIMAVAFLPGSLLFAGLAAPVILSQWSAFLPVWNVLALTCTVALPVLLGSVSFAASLGTLRWIAAATTLLTLAMQASLPFAALRPLGDQAPWLQAVLALGVLPSPIAWGPSTGVWIALATSVLTAGDRLALGATRVNAIQDALYLSLFCITFIALGVRALALARSVDAAARTASASTIAAAVERARAREQARVNALVHDQVLATLLGAARSVSGTDEAIARDASQALGGLGSLLDPRMSGSLSPEEFVFGLQTAATQLAPDALFGYEIESPTRRVPFAVSEALAFAMEEALRNVAAHAGDAANCTVHARVASDTITVDVIDDGEGFDRTLVPPTRLGLVESIEGRMRLLDGGEATIVSRPGIGTRVVLRYRDPAP